MARRTSIYIEGFRHVNPIPAACVIDNVIMSGLISGVDRITGKMPTSLEEQSTNMYARMQQIVEASGGHVNDIIKVTVWISDRNAREAANPAWIALFPDERSRPARSTVNRDLDGGKLIEAEFTAILARAEV